METHVVAHVKWIQGDKKLSRFIESAGLGLTGVGVVVKYAVHYKPGEQVTKQRVEDMLQKLMDTTNSDTSVDFCMHCPEVLSISEERN